MSTTWIDDLDREIVRRDFTPKLIHEAPIRALVRQYDDPAEAWEALVAKGFLAASWAFSPSRSFEEHDGITSWDSWLDRARPRAFAHPTSIDGCLNAAAGARSLVTAEMLAFELVRALSPTSHPTRVVWALSPTRLPVPGEHIGFASLERGLRNAASFWKRGPEKKRSFRDRSAVRRAAALAESEKRLARCLDALDHPTQPNLFDPTLTSAVAHARMLEAEGLLVSNLAYRGTMARYRSWSTASANIEVIAQPIERLFEPIKTLLTLLALGVGVGPVVDDTVILVLRG